MMVTDNRFAYILADVFTDRIFGGNPLAVFPDGRDLADREMQLIARELNLSETVFVLPPDEERHTKRLRIFTPAVELPFAGHPTVGTAVVLAEIGAFGPPADLRNVVFEEGIGPVPVRIARAADSPATATFTAARLPEFGPDAPLVARLARVLGLDPSRLMDAEVRPRSCSAGVPFTIVPVVDRAALAAARIDAAAWQAALAGGWAPQVYAINLQDWSRGREVRARTFAPAMGIAEDPATGAAAAALSGFLVDLQRPNDGEHRWVIRQGEEMGRPSVIDLSVDIAAGRIAAVRVGGGAVIVGRGELTLRR